MDNEDESQLSDVNDDDNIENSCPNSPVKKKSKINEKKAGMKYVIMENLKHTFFSFCFLIPFLITAFTKSEAIPKKPTLQKKAKSKFVDISLTSEQIEFLILEVQKREPLWNFRTEPAERERTAMKILWDEVAGLDKFEGK